MQHEATEKPNEKKQQQDDEDDEKYQLRIWNVYFNQRQKNRLH